MRGLALCVSMASVLLVGCGDEAPAALLASAKGYLAKKDANAAVIQLKSALQQQPDLAEARFLLGRTLLDSGDAVPAEIELRKALDLKYPDSSVLPVLARALVQQGKAQRAIQDFAAVELNQPEATADLKTTLAVAYTQQGDNAKAQQALSEALRVVPDFAPALLMQARLKATVRDSDAAFALVERVIAKNPDNYEALQLKGDFLFVFNADVAQALEAERQALAKRPDWLPAHSSTLEILLSRRDLAAAKTQLEQTKTMFPNHLQTKYFEARLAFLNQDYKTARELAQQLLAAAPTDMKVLLLAGGIELQAGSLAQAESLAAKASQRSPDAVMPRRLLAQIFLRSGQPKQAQDALAPAIEKPDVDAETLNLAGEAALKLGDAANAESYFARAAKLSPNNARSRTALALTQFSKGNADAAFAQLQEIASSDTSTVADMAIISARIRQHDYNGALKAIGSLERKQPGKPFAAQLRGQVELAREDIAAARRSFASALAIDPLYFPAAASLAALDVRDKKPDEAQKRFDKLLAADPKNLQALLAVAELRAQAGAKKEEVAALLVNAIKLNPTAAVPRLLLIELQLRGKDNQAALTAAQEGVAALPDNPDLLDALGRVQLTSGDTNQAISTFGKLAALQPRSAQPNLRLADAYIAAKNPGAAHDSLKRALEITPKLLAAQRGLIMLELAAEKPEQAIALARSVQRERPDQNVGYVLAGDIEAFRKNWNAAAASYRAGLNRGASSELAAKLYSALVLGKKNAESDSFAAGWIKAHPQDAAFRGHVGDLAIQQVNFARAESEYLAVVKLQPDNALALNNLAWITYKLKKPGATALAEKANALRPEQPAFMDTLATLFADDGQIAKALELEKKAVALAPDFHLFRLNLAKLYLKSGDKALARAELERLTKLGDKFAGQAEVGELLKTL